MTFEIEKIYRVRNNDEGTCIEIGPDGDGLGCVEIRTVGTKNQEWYGNISLKLPKEQALLLAEALNDAAEALK